MNFKKIDKNAVTPTYGTKHSAGMDLYALTYLDNTTDITEKVYIHPGETKLIHTGISVEIPDGYFGAVFARSGLSTKQGLRPANCVGVIDSDYRGEVMVSLHNDSENVGKIYNGDRIAQLVIIPYKVVTLTEVDSLSNTDRGTGGFGSTGK